MMGAGVLILTVLGHYLFRSLIVGRDFTHHGPTQ